MSYFTFDELTPNAEGQWLEQSLNSLKFRRLLPLANRQGKLASMGDAEQTAFGLFANAVKSNRDEWVYDFDIANLRAKALFFADAYNAALDAGDESYDPVIKWSSSLRDGFKRGESIVYNDGDRIQSLWRPFVSKWHVADPAMNDRLTKYHYEMFGPDLRQPNQVINVCVNGKDFYALATDKPVDYHFVGDTQCLPLYRYTADGERVCNISDWAVQQFNKHRRLRWPQYYERHPDEPDITAEDIFAYTYAVLHDPVYRRDYRADLLREFPRLPYYFRFSEWVEMGQMLLDCHLGFEAATPYELERVENETAPADGGKPILRVDKARGLILLDERTTLAGVPEAAWEYELGSRTALEWVLEQYRERKPRDKTIAAKFNTYRFADHKEQVIDLLRRVCAVSEATADIVAGMAYWLDGQLAVSGERDEYEWSLTGLLSALGPPGSSKGVME